MTETQNTDLDLIGSNSKAIADLTDVLGQLQDGQGMLIKFISEQQGILREFRQLVKTIIKGVEQSQTQTNKNIESLATEINCLRDDFLTMHKEVMDLLRDFANRTQSDSD